MTEDNEEMVRHECPNCGKSFDVAGNQWQNEGLICPYCGAEIE
jgi:DNA-directed RNA polymerase subunit RPC12/RpoP